MSTEPAPEATGDETPQRLSTGELLEFAGISVRQADHWVRQNWVFPEHEGGSGNGRMWPPQEAEIARRMGLLAAAGLPLPWSAVFARNGWPGPGELAGGIEVRVTK